MAKPASIVSWPATGHITEPPGAKKTQGWLGADKPPAEFLNWLFNLLGQWTSYVHDLESTEQLTWALSQIFNRAITLGDDFEATEADAVSPRLIAEPVSSATADHTCTGKFKDARTWSKGLGSSSAWSLTVNATRTTDGTDKWTKITTSQPAYMFQISRDGLSFSAMPATQNTAWTDAFVSGDGTWSGWGRQLFFQSEGAAQTTANQQFPLLSKQFNTGATPRGYWGEFKIGGVSDCRIYVVRTEGTLGTTNTQGLEIIFGATWDAVAGNWVRDNTNDITRYVLGAKGFFVERKNGAAVGTFSTFDTTLFDLLFPIAGSGTGVDHGKLKLTNTTLAITGTTADDADDANPPAKTAQANKIGVRNIAKVTAYFDSLGGADGNISPYSGFNLLNAADAVAQAADVITVKFGTALDSGNYEAQVTCQVDSTTAMYVPQIKSKSNDRCTIRIMKTTTGGVTSVVDLNTEQIGVNLTIFGKQDT